ncbi:hypothetical protein BDP27DRAFT_1322025 [Rhodocollybia butyracea]|uniref:Peptidase M50 domain-containing protein n=1 Tax=Rhodocollybia butyracea TaxID=206335 RepID=A0A9P5UAZ8_9AGAR|nr:hypothetical protein BDP27DRAFT_1322025 [Rhodocollybia butyracea]
MATLSLFFFNLLPLPLLDGAQFLTALLDYLRPSSPPIAASSEIISAAESGMSLSSHRQTRWGSQSMTSTASFKRRFERLMQIVTFGMIGIYGVLMVVRI